MSDSRLPVRVPYELLSAEDKAGDPGNRFLRVWQRIGTFFRGKGVTADSVAEEAVNYVKGLAEQPRADVLDKVASAEEKQQRTVLMMRTVEPEVTIKEAEAGIKLEQLKHAQIETEAKRIEVECKRIELEEKRIELEKKRIELEESNKLRELLAKNGMASIPKGAGSIYLAPLSKLGIAAELCGEPEQADDLAGDEPVNQGEQA